jgi:hypothetical protein
MRDYGIIHTAYWTDDKIAALSDAAKLLGAYLLTCPHSNAIGCFRLPMGYISEDLHWSPDKVRSALRELSGIGFICRDETSTWTLIRNFLAFNTIENPNVGKACMRLADAVPSSFPFFHRLIEALEPHAHRLAAGYIDALRGRVAKCQAAPQGGGGNDGGNGSAEPFRNGSANPSETVSEPFSEPFRNPEPNLTRTEDSVASATGTDAPSEPTLKSELFGKCLVWLIVASGQAEKSLRPMIGRWIKLHGEGAVLAAIVCAQRESAVSPVGFIEAILKAGSKRHGQANGSKHERLRHAFGGAFSDLLDPGTASSGGERRQLAIGYH